MHKEGLDGLDLSLYYVSMGTAYNGKWMNKISEEYACAVGLKGPTINARFVFFVLVVYSIVVVLLLII